MIYVFAIVPSGTVVDGRVVRSGDVAAVVEEVDAADFGEDALNRNMADMGWLAPRAAHHQATCARLMEASPALIPLAFGTVFRDESGVRAMLVDRRDELARRLLDVRGRAEWVVALHRDGPAARAYAVEAAPEVVEARRQIEAAPPGRAYLLGRLMEEAQRQAVLDLDRDALIALERGVEPLVERAYREPLAEGVASASGGSGMIARMSLLVSRARDAELRERLDALAEEWARRGYDVELTGPWPAYRFGGAS